MEKHLMSQCLVLMQSVIDGKVQNGDLSRVSEALGALIQKPSSVRVNRRLLKFPWADPERYLSSVKNGYVLVLLGEEQKSNMIALKEKLVDFGVVRSRIKVQVADISKISKFLDDRNCKVVLYSKTVSNAVKDALPKEVSAMFQSLKADHVKKALAEINEKLK